MTIIHTMKEQYEIEAIDISEYQGFNANGAPTPIDFVAAKATRPSLRWMMVKMSEGSWTGYPESVFQKQITDAQNAGWDTSPYHFDHQDVSVSDQARHMATRYKGAYKGNMPLAIDLEDNFPAKYAPPTAAMSAMEIAARTPVAIEMFLHTRDILDAASQLSGQPSIGYSGDWYTNWYFWLTSIAGKDMSWIHKHKWWMADYNALQMRLPFGMDLSDVILHQWTSSPPVGKRVNGFPWNARLDQNNFLGTVAQYETLRGTPVVIPPVIPPVVVGADPWETIYILLKRIELLEKAGLSFRAELDELNRWRRS